MFKLERDQGCPSQEHLVACRIVGSGQLWFLGQTHASVMHDLRQAVINQGPRISGARAVKIPMGRAKPTAGFFSSANLLRVGWKIVIIDPHALRKLSSQRNILD